MTELLADNFRSKVNKLRDARRLTLVQDPKEKMQLYLQGRFPNTMEEGGRGKQCQGTLQDPHQLNSHQESHYLNWRKYP